MKVCNTALGLLAGIALAGPAVANEIQATYNLAAGATSPAINVPAVNTPISITCVQNAVGFRGVAQVTMLRTAVAPLFLEWIGLDIAGGAITSNFSASAGTHIVYCDYTGKTVDMQVASGSSIKIVNTSSQQATRVINFVW